MKDEELDKLTKKIKEIEDEIAEIERLYSDPADRAKYYSDQCVQSYKQLKNQLENTEDEKLKDKIRQDMKICMISKDQFDRVLYFWTQSSLGKKTQSKLVTKKKETKKKDLSSNKLGGWK